MEIVPEGRDDSESWCYSCARRTSGQEIPPERRNARCITQPYRRDPRINDQHKARTSALCLAFSIDRGRI